MPMCVIWIFLSKIYIQYWLSMFISVHLSSGGGKSDWLLRLAKIALKVNDVQSSICLDDYNLFPSKVSWVLFYYSFSLFTT